MFWLFHGNQGLADFEHIRTCYRRWAISQTCCVESAQLENLSQCCVDQFGEVFHCHNLNSTLYALSAPKHDDFIGSLANLGQLYQMFFIKRIHLGRGKTGRDARARRTGHANLQRIRTQSKLNVSKCSNPSVATSDNQRG